MKGIMLRQRLELALRWLLGAIFLWAGWAKDRDVQAFGDTISAFKMLPNSLINLIAFGLPQLEVLIGAMLIFSWWKRAAAFSTMILLLAFTLALFQAWVRGLTIDCGCLGAETWIKWTPETAFWRDLGLLFAALLLYVHVISKEATCSSR